MWKASVFVRKRPTVEASLPLRTLTNAFEGENLHILVARLKVKTLDTFSYFQ